MENLEQFINQLSSGQIICLGVTIGTMLAFLIAALLPKQNKQK